MAESLVYVNGVEVVPRVDVQVSCEFQSNVDTQIVGQAISKAIKALTGNPAQVIVNNRDKSGQTGRINMWKMQNRMKTNNIELRPPYR